MFTQQSGPDDVGVDELLEPFFGESDQATKDFFVVLTEHRGWCPSDELRTCGKVDRASGIEDIADGRLGYAFEEAVGNVLGQGVYLSRSHNFGHRNPLRPQRLDDIVTRPPLTPSAQMVVELTVGCSTALWRCQPGSSIQSG